MENPLPVDWRPLFEWCNANIGLPSQLLVVFFVLVIFSIWNQIRLLGFATSLLWTMGELVGGGSVAMAVGASNRWQVAGDTRHMICDTFICFVWTFYVFHFCCGKLARCSSVPQTPRPASHGQEPEDEDRAPAPSSITTLLCTIVQWLVTCNISKLPPPIKLRV